MTVRLGVSFDFYDTLVEIDRDVSTIAETLTAMGYPCNAAIEKIWNAPGFDGQVTHRSGQPDYDIWRRSCLANLAMLCGAAAADAPDIADQLIKLDRSWTVKATPWAGDLLDTVRAAGAASCILSNWDYPLAPYLAMAGLDPTFPVLTSAELGCRKPAVAAFVAARTMMSVAPDRHLHIGDSWDADVCGAIRSGARALWITDAGRDGLPAAIMATPPMQAAACLRQWLRDGRC